MKGLGTRPSMITILTGASLRIIVAGASSNFIMVNTEFPANASTFQYYGLPANSNLYWNCSTARLGTLYAPSTTVALYGGGDPGTPSDYQGACVGDSIVLNGHFNFHFDENLVRIGLER